VLEAYFEKRTRPSPAQIFDFKTSKAARLKPDGTLSLDFPLDGFDGELRAREDLAEPWAQWADSSSSGPNADVHCWAFSPASFHLLLQELRSLGLMGMEVEELGPTEGIEFVVHLRKSGKKEPLDESEDRLRRRKLLQAVLDEEKDRQRAIFIKSFRLKIKAALPKFLRDPLAKLWSAWKNR
jgi:hypothetical protein